MRGVAKAIHGDAVAIAYSYFLCTVYEYTLLVHSILNGLEYIGTWDSGHRVFSHYTFVRESTFT